MLFSSKKNYFLQQIDPDKLEQNNQVENYKALYSGSWLLNRWVVENQGK